MQKHYKNFAQRNLPGNGQILHKNICKNIMDFYIFHKLENSLTAFLIFPLIVKQKSTEFLKVAIFDKISKCKSCIFKHINISR